MRFLPLLLTLFGCPGDKDDTAAGGDSGGEDSGGGGVDDLPSLTDDLDTGGCEEAEAVDEVVTGAAVYFFGEYAITGTDEEGNNVWEGTEYYLVFANDAWVEEGGEDCQVVWSGSLTETSPSGCGSCEIGLEGAISLDVVATTCPESVASWAEGDVTYMIDVDDDGNATWYLGSGTELGTGYYEEGAANYLSEKQCDWY